MVLGGQHHVLRAGAAEEVRPCRRVEILRREVRREVVVRLVRIALRVVLHGLGAVLPALGVGVVLRIAVVNAILAAGRERRNGVNAPVDEYAELGVLPPLRTWPSVERFPVGVIRLCRRAHAQYHRRDNRRDVPPREPVRPAYLRPSVSHTSHIAAFPLLLHTDHISPHNFSVSKASLFAESIQKRQPPVC